MQPHQGTIQTPRYTTKLTDMERAAIWLERLPTAPVRFDPQPGPSKMFGASLAAIIYSLGSLTLVRITSSYEILHHLLQFRKLSARTVVLDSRSTSLRFVFYRL